MRLHFYYDVACPYAYLAATAVEALAARAGAELRWVPVLLGGLFRAVGATQNPAALMNPAKARLNLLDMQRAAERRGVPLTMPAAHPRRSVEAMRLLTAATGATRVALTHALYRAYWVEGLDVADGAVLDALAVAHGLDPAVRAEPAVKQALFDATAEAAGHGAFGVPALVVGGDPETGAGGAFFWGQDRLHQVEQALGLGATPAPLWTPPAALPTPAEAPTLRLYHDFASPFSYLGFSQAERLAADFGARFEPRPMLLGALFRALGTPGVPLFAMSAVRQKAIARDLQRWAAWWGVPYRFPAVFPQRTVLALRVALQVPAATGHLYRRLWGEGDDLGDPAVVAATLAAAFRAGIEPPRAVRAAAPGPAERQAEVWAAAVVAGAEDPAVKDQLRLNTEAAQAAGACGAPTFEVCWPGQKPVLFWGQDRLDQVAAALGGWRPHAG